MSGNFTRRLEGLTSKIDVKLILMVSLGLHLFAISFPRDAKVFDEAYYVPAALDLLKLTPSNLEHPFLGKAWIALGIVFFGDNWFGWRISSVVFGVLSLYVFYRLSLHLIPPILATYGTLLLALENMFFIHSSLALLEVPSIFFGLFALFLYFSRRYYWVALSLGLSVLSKETGILFFLTLSTYHIIRHRPSFVSLGGLKKPLIFLIIMLGTVLLPMTAYDLAYQPQASFVQVVVTEYRDPGDTLVSRATTTETRLSMAPITNALEHIRYIVGYASSLTIGRQDNLNAGNYAWSWILPAPYTYPPSVYYAISVNKTIIEQKDGAPTVRSILTQPIAWIAVGNMPIWWSIWITVPVAACMLARRRSTQTEPFLLSWIGATYLPMLFLSFGPQRIVYPFYFLNTIPALTLGIPYLATFLLADRRLLSLGLITYSIIVLFFFAAYYPVRIFEQ